MASWGSMCTGRGVGGWTGGLVWLGASIGRGATGTGLTVDAAGGGGLPAAFGTALAAALLVIAAAVADGLGAAACLGFGAAGVDGRVATSFAATGTGFGCASWGEDTD
jgi:hypothetical protein